MSNTLHKYDPELHVIVRTRLHLVDKNIKLGINYLKRKNNADKEPVLECLVWIESSLIGFNVNTDLIGIIDNDILSER